MPGFDGYNVATYPPGAVGWVYWGVCWVCTTIAMSYIVQVGGWWVRRY